MKVGRLLPIIATIGALLPCAQTTYASSGANLPWTTYEAENCQTDGSILGPDYTGQTPSREASGRRCVKLDAAGQYMEFKSQSEAQGMIIRYCLPDSPDGRGIDATLSLYINGRARNKLPLTSRYSYLYGDYPFSNDPSQGNPRHFWDEARLMPGMIHRGDTIRLQKDADDSAAAYLIDFVDLEPIAPALQKPSGAISVADYGAVGDGKTNDRDAFLAAMNAAKNHRKTVWIPAGQFLVAGSLPLNDITIQGAGMWYSTLVGAENYKPENRLRLEGQGSHITLADFAIRGNLNYRNDSEANDGLVGSFGAGSVIRNIWVEHTKTGAWLTNSDGLLVENCRFRDTIADGINLCLGMRNTTIRNCTARGNGDDCFAIWPATYDKSVYEAGHNRIINCTAQLPFLAQGFSVYGGEANSVENCSATDIPYGAGTLVSTMFPTVSGFHGITAFHNIQMQRAGDRDGAIAVMTNLRPLSGVRFDNITVSDSPTDGIKFTCVAGKTISDAQFDHIRIINPGVSGSGSGIVEAPNAVGSATMNDVTVRNPRTTAWQTDATAFKLIRNSGTAGTNDHRSTSAKYSVAQPVTLGP
ncbi:MAG TPA: glycosyl hydrolase family 28-related protein [Tepidisphaeraceae bacterium]|jgi:parallel beta-helix repeat protein